MKLDVTVEARDMIYALVDVYGDDYDTLAEFMKACATTRDIEVKSDADWYDMMAEISDDQIKSEYDLRFDQDEDRDVIAGVEELARGNHALARTLFDRAGQEELSRAI